jgi:hypothetical protein
MEFFDMIVSQYGSVHKCAAKLGTNREQLLRQIRTGDRRVLDAIADNCRLSRQEVKWEFRYHTETMKA